MAASIAGAPFARGDGATTLNASLGEVVDPTSYYFRINPLFETANANYDWLNRVVAIGIGHRRPEVPIYSVVEVL